MSDIDDIWDRYDDLVRELFSLPLEDLFAEAEKREYRDGDDPEAAQFFGEHKNVMRRLIDAKGFYRNE